MTLEIKPHVVLILSQTVCGNMVETSSILQIDISKEKYFSTTHLNLPFFPSWYLLPPVFRQNQTVRVHIYLFMKKDAREGNLNI
jgi:hypothetical protein